MNTFYNEHYSKICRILREIEEQSECSDELFYCSYLLGLLGIQEDNMSETKAFKDKYEFDGAFLHSLLDAMKQENIIKEDQSNICLLWEKIQSV